MSGEAFGYPDTWDLTELPRRYQDRPLATLPPDTTTGGGVESEPGPRFRFSAGNPTPVRDLNHRAPRKAATMGTQQGTVNFSFALAVDLARMGLWPDGVKFTDPSAEQADPEGDAVDQAVEAWERDRERFVSYATPEEQYDDPNYDAYLAELERMCNRSYVMGPVHDPSATYCDRDRGHSGKHEGDSPFDDGRIRWNGGGSIEGDPLPVNDVEFIQVGAQR